MSILLAFSHMFSALFNVEFLSQLFQLFLAHYFCFGFAAEFIICFEFVVIIYRTILSLLCSMIFVAARVFLTKCLLEIICLDLYYSVASVLEMTATVEPQFNKHLYKEVLGLTDDILHPSNGKIYEKRTSILRNLYVANTFCQSLGPSSTSTVLPSYNVLTVFNLNSI